MKVKFSIWKTDTTGETETEYKFECEVSEGRPATMDDPAEQTEVEILSIEPYINLSPEFADEVTAKAFEAYDETECE
jgi:hypothetical protein